MRESSPIRIDAKNSARRWWLIYNTEISQAYVRGLDYIQTIIMYIEMKCTNIKRDTRSIASFLSTFLHLVCHRTVCRWSRLDMIEILFVTVRWKAPHGLGFAIGSERLSSIISVLTR